MLNGARRRIGLVWAEEDDHSISDWRHDTEPEGLSIDFNDFWLRDDKKIYSMAHLWSPKKVVGIYPPWADYVTIEQVPAFSSRAVEVLGDLLEPDGELLPAIFEDRQYYAYNCMKLHDVFNREASRCRDSGYNELSEQYSSITYIDEFVLDIDEQKQSAFFRIPQFSDYFVTQAFVERVMEAGLFGFVFDQIWPAPKRGIWWRNAQYRRNYFEKQYAAYRRKKGELPPFESGPYLELPIPQTEPESEERVEPPSSPVAERAIDPEHLEMVEEDAVRMAELLGVNHSSDPPLKIVEAIDQCLIDLQQGKGPAFPDDLDKDIALGALWGLQLVRQFGWQWATVTFPDQPGSAAAGIFSPDRSVGIYVFHYVYGCLENDAEVKIALAFNMLLDPKTKPDYPAKGYVNWMDQVHYIVPR